MGSLIHLLKSSLGTGVLAMPMAFKNGGLIFGSIGTVIVGIICTHCVYILVSSKIRLNVYLLTELSPS
jgi:proton-coupled amino acid transporter